MTLCTRDSLLGLTARRFRTVDIGDYVFRIRSLSEAEKSEFEAAVLSSEGKYSLAKIKRQRRRLICLCLVDELGNPLLQAGDEAGLEAVDGAVTHKLYNACREHCGFEDGDLEELVKNSAGSQGGSSLDA